MNPPPVSEPFTGTEIARDFEHVGRWAAEYWQSFAVEEFFRPLGDAWSPADNVRHLTRSNRPVAKALSIPRVVLLLRFGFTRRPSRTYSSLRATYVRALDDGLRAGNYAPAPLAATETTARKREEILTRWSESVAHLTAGARSWSESALDHLRLPHPGLGLLTVREMLFFTLYHNTHHVLGVARRRERGSEGERQSVERPI